MHPQVKISLNLLPFGSRRIQIPGTEKPEIERKPEMPRYVVPSTTNVERIDIRFYEDGGTYSAPKTTAG